MSTLPAIPVTTQSAPVETPEQLALRAQRGSLDAYSALVGRLEVRLFNFLLRRVGSPADAEDVAQEAFIRAWERIGQYNPRWRFSTWLFTIASRIAASRYRERPNPPVRLVVDKAWSGASPGERLHRGEERARVWELAAEALSPEQHTALWLRYAEDMAIGEIARVLGKSEVGVRVMLFRARGVLAQKLGEVDGSWELKPSKPPGTPRERRGPTKASPKLVGGAA